MWPTPVHSKQVQPSIMNATVEVETLSVSAKAEGALVTTSVAPVLEVKAPVSTSTLRVISQGTHSISAVAPDAIFKNGGLAVA